jgi:hypothetical protein
MAHLKVTVFRFNAIKCAICVEGLMEVKYAYKSSVKNEYWKEIIGCTVYWTEMWWL